MVNNVPGRQLNLTREQLEILDREARKRGWSRSFLVRLLLDDWIRRGRPVPELREEES